MSDANRSDALAADDLVRGQFVGYRNEPGVAPDSDVEDLLRPAGFHRLVALDGGSVVPTLWQVPARDRD